MSASRHFRSKPSTVSKLSWWRRSREDFLDGAYLYTAAYARYDVAAGRGGLEFIELPAMIVLTRSVNRSCRRCSNYHQASLTDLSIDRSDRIRATKSASEISVMAMMADTIDPSGPMVPPVNQAGYRSDGVSTK